MIVDGLVNDMRPGRQLPSPKAISVYNHSSRSDRRARRAANGSSIARM
jgi:hypothetical protein